MRVVIRAFATLAIWTALAVTAVAKDQDLERAADAEGLVKVHVQGLQQVYARPDADLSAYRQVLLDPIEVSFSKGWNPKLGGQEITAAEKQEIREGLARVLREEFTRELGRSGTYQVVDTVAEGVLRIKADIRDLRLNAPDVLRPGVVRTYTMSTGEMTLVAELRDGPSGELIARVIDRERDQDSAWFELTTRIDNVAAAREAARQWAGALRRQLDAAHSMPKGSTSGDVTSDRPRN